MATTNGNRKILDLKRWEFCSPLPTATVAGSFIASSRHYRQQQLFVAGNSSQFLYNPSEDGWVATPVAALAGTFGAGAAGCAGAWSTGTTVAASQLTATGGTTSTIVTNQTLARDLRGYSVHITGGPNAGVTLAIVSNTIGANATITVAAQASAFSASTTYRLCTPVWYVVGAGTLASGSFRKYDFATNTWTTLNHSPNFAASLGTDGKLISTPSWMDTGYLQFATGTATSATATTLVNSAKSWTTNQWVNSQVRIVSGTGAGQIRTITANDATSVTVATWTTTPDSTSVYSIEGNDDFLYYMGNNAVTLYRYSISGNSWTTLNPTTPRTAAPGAGMSGHWIWDVNDADWTSESAIRNGRRIYSFRGGAGGALDYYDIASNTWVSGITYAPSATLSTGAKYAYHGNYLYFSDVLGNRWYTYDYVMSSVEGWGVTIYPAGTLVVGDTAFDITYRDGATEIVYIYNPLNSSTIMLRQMVI